jgi:hypothetical protein
MAADGEGSAPFVGEKVGGGLEDGLEEPAGLLLIPGKEGLHQTGQLRLGPIGDHLAGVVEQLALELDDLLGRVDLVARHPSGKRLPPGLEGLDFLLALLEEGVHLLFAHGAAIDPEGVPVRHLFHVGPEGVEPGLQVARHNQPVGVEPALPGH